MEILARIGWRELGKILHDTTGTIANDTPAARCALQPFIVGQLHALLAAVVDIGHAHELRGDLTGRIKAAVFTL